MNRWVPLALLFLGTLACQSSRQHGFVDLPARPTGPPVWVDGEKVFVRIDPDGQWTMPATLDAEIVDDEVLLSCIHISTTTSQPFVLSERIDTRSLSPGWEDRLWWLEAESLRFGGASAAATLEPSRRRRARRVPAPGSEAR